MSENIGFKNNPGASASFTDFETDSQIVNSGDIILRKARIFLNNHKKITILGIVIGVLHFLFDAIQAIFAVLSYFKH